MSSGMALTLGKRYDGEVTAINRIVEGRVMRGVVVYDTHYGNTKIVAQAIAEQLKAEGHEVELRSVREHPREAPQGDIMFLGSPVRLGAVSGRVKRYVRKLDGDVWKNKPIVVFTTTLMLPKDATDEQKRNQDKWDWGAGRKLRDLAKLSGLNAVEKHLWVEVKGMKGPLVEMGVQSAKQFTRDMLLSLKD
jgi:menaquinone-dependent protoporphyrinogen IX oxidase